MTGQSILWWLMCHDRSEHLIMTSVPWQIGAAYDDLCTVTGQNSIRWLLCHDGSEHLMMTYVWWQFRRMYFHYVYLLVSEQQCMMILCTMCIMTGQSKCTMTIRDACIITIRESVRWLCLLCVLQQVRAAYDVYMCLVYYNRSEQDYTDCVCPVYSF